MSIKWSNYIQIHIFIFILSSVWCFYTASETYLGIKIVKTLAINLLTLIDPS
ncbi:hypothetical protein E2C01_099277 [Portunus trituberculatus]|uniref:Uncharacterized protein n=1 Tax=Portunus trituberculatus TaxID=210409 RepID=A0A5B7KGG5_PORTR|nr:hypothetical protein [Portunus trituberculatus]